MGNNQWMWKICLCNDRSTISDDKFYIPHTFETCFFGKLPVILTTYAPAGLSIAKSRNQSVVIHTLRPFNPHALQMGPVPTNQLHVNLNASRHQMLQNLVRKKHRDLCHPKRTITFSSIDGNLYLHGFLRGCVGTEVKPCDINLATLNGIQAWLEFTRLYFRFILVLDWLFYTKGYQERNCCWPVSNGTRTFRKKSRDAFPVA